MCDASCPLAQHGACRPSQLIGALLGNPGTGEVEPELFWLCTTCYLCQERCPTGLAITDLILAERRRQFGQDDVAPEPYYALLERLYRTGHLVPPNEAVLAKREELGLPRLPPTTLSCPEKLREIRCLLKAIFEAEEKP